jgi:hypothetical protein
MSSNSTIPYVLCEFSSLFFFAFYTMDLNVICIQQKGNIRLDIKKNWSPKYILKNVKYNQI